MFARIYRPSRTAMQSGKAKSEHWVLEFAPLGPQSTEPLMGWTSSADTLGSQVRMKFDTRDEAIAYAKAENLPFQVEDRDPPKPVAKSYSDNFSFRRRLPWTH